MAKITNDDVFIQQQHDKAKLYVEKNSTSDYCQVCFKNELKEDDCYICEDCLEQLEINNKQECKDCKQIPCVCDLKYEMYKEERDL